MKKKRRNRIRRLKGKKRNDDIVEMREIADEKMRKKFRASARKSSETADQWSDMLSVEAKLRANPTFG